MGLDLWGSDWGSYSAACTKQKQNPKKFIEMSASVKLQKVTLYVSLL
jgi:hypothetical protein